MMLAIDGRMLGMRLTLKLVESDAVAATVAIPLMRAWDNTTAIDVTIRNRSPMRSLPAPVSYCIGSSTSSDRCENISPM
jgi:hypothetical protein